MCQKDMATLLLSSASSAAAAPASTYIHVYPHPPRLQCVLSIIWFYQGFFTIFALFCYINFPWLQFLCWTLLFHENSFSYFHKGVSLYYMDNIAKSKTVKKIFIGLWQHVTFEIGFQNFIVVSIFGFDIFFFHFVAL